MELPNEKDILENIHSPDKLFNSLEERHYSLNSDERLEFTHYLVNIADTHNIDWLDLATTAIDNGFNSWNIFEILQDVIPKVVCNIESGVKLIHLALNPSSCGNFPLHSLTKIAEEAPALAKEMLVEVKAIDNENISGCISALYFGLANENFKNIHQEIVYSLPCENIFITRGLLNCLARFSYDADKDSELIKITLAKINSLNDSEDVIRSVVDAYGFLAKFSDESIEQLLLLSNKYKEGVDFQYQLPLVLSRLCDDSLEEEWFDKLLLSLSAVSTSSSKTIDSIGYLLRKIINNNSYEKATNFIKVWIIDSDYKLSPNRFDEVWEPVMAKIINNKVGFSTLLLYLINHDDSVYHKVFLDLTLYCYVRRYYQLNFLSSDLSSLSEDDVLYVCRKILGYVDNPQILCPLIFSILQEKYENKSLANMLASIFATYIGANYTGTTLEFLQGKIDDSSEKIAVRNICQLAFKELEETNTERKELLRLNELKPPHKCYLQIIKADNKIYNEERDKVNENSIMNKISTTVPVKYGKGCFSYRMNNYSEVSNFSSFSHSVEVPKFDIFHPVHTAMQRLEFRLAKRGDK